MIPRQNPGKPPLRNRRALACAVALTLSSCSALSRHSDDAVPAQEGAPMAASAPNAPTPEAKLAQKDQEITALRGTVETLTQKVETLQNKLTLSEPAKGKRQNLDAAKAGALSGYDVGAEVNPGLAAGDPAQGFVSDAAVQAYRQGKVLFDSGKYPEAILAFAAMIERQPKHVLAANAQFYLAQSYYNQNEWGLARQEWLKLVDQYERAPLVSESLKGLALCAEKLGDADESRRHRVEITTLFPSSPAAAAFLNRREAAPETAPPMEAPAPRAIAQPTPPTPPKAPSAAPAEGGNGAALDEIPTTAPVGGGAESTGNAAHAAESAGSG